MAKKIKNNRRKKQKQAKQGIRPALEETLAMLEKGKTPPEIVDAHIAFYETCNPLAQQVLLDIFKERESQMETDIFEFFEEKDNART